MITTALFSMTASATTTPHSDNTMNLSNQEKAIALLNSIETGDEAAGSDGAALQALPKNSAKVKVVRSFSDGDYVFTHTDYNFFGPKVGFDIFKFENGLIVEHWDNLAKKSKTTSPSGRTQIDGPTLA